MKLLTLEARSDDNVSRTTSVFSDMVGEGRFKTAWKFFMTGFAVLLGCDVTLVLSPNVKDEPQARQNTL